jgi:hypothetical protein
MVTKTFLPALALLGATAFAADQKVDFSKIPAASSRSDVTYAKDIKPIFEKSCFKCHGEEKQKGKLRLDSLEAVKKGGEDGDVVTPGDSKKSIIVQAVSGALEDGMMPPEDKGKPLTKDQIGLIRAWIDHGAK